MRLPNAENAYVEQAKISSYLLSPDHPQGRSKATFFTGLGFNIDQWQEFSDALRVQAMSHDVAVVLNTIYGPRYIIDGVIDTPGGAAPFIRTVWQVEPASGRPKLITAYPAERR